MLRTVHDRVQALVTSGKTLPDVLAAKPPAELDAEWGHGPVTVEQFVTMVFEAASKP